MPFSVKCVFNTDIRRFQLPSVSLSDLRSSLREAYGYDETRYVFKYEDDEQELVTITTQQELVEAINIVGKTNRLLKLFVTLKEAAASLKSTAEPPAPIAAPASAEAPKETPKQAPVETAAPTSTAPPTTTTPTPTPTDESKPSNKPADLSDCRTCINLILELLSDPIFLRALPSLALAAIDAFVATQSFEKTLDAVINVNDGVKNHASVVALLPHARRYAPLADIKYAHAKGFLLGLLPMARQYVTLLPTLLPRVVEYLMSVLEQWDRAEKEEIKQDGQDPMFSVLENVAQTVQSHPMIAPILSNLGIDPSAIIQQGWRCHPFAQMLRRGGGGGGGGGCPMRGSGWGARRGGWGRRFEQATTPQPTPAATEPAGEQVHSNIICDMCNVNPIRGIRFKCTVCPDYDLCETCESTGRHPLDHPLIKIVRGKRVPEEELHSGVACDGCRQYPIRGIRYKCSTCRDYDLCSSCESKNIHPAEHNLIKIKTPAVRPVDAGSSHHHHHHHHGRYWDMNRARRFNHCPGWRQPEVEAPQTPATPTSAAASSTSTPPSARFVRDANLTDRTEVAPNQTLIKTWIVSNSGDRTWPSGSKLIFVRGDRQLSTEEEFIIPCATPGQQVEINAVLHTPTTPGRYTAYFRLADAERNVFGPRVWVDLVVVGSDGTPTPAPASAPVPAATTSSSSSAVTVEDEPVVEDVKQAAAEDVQSAPTSSPATPTPAAAESVVVSTPPSPNHGADDFVHVQAPEPVAVFESTVASAPVPGIEASPARPASAPASASPSFESVFPIQNNALVSMGFTDRDLNEWVLNKHGGNLQNAANWLLERIKL